MHKFCKTEKQLDGVVIVTYIILYPYVIFKSFCQKICGLDIFGCPKHGDFVAIQCAKGETLGASHESSGAAGGPQSVGTAGVKGSVW